MTAKIDPRELRNCFGKFATGITVITTIAPDGTHIGLTVNSFSSLSIDPPMILWSLDKKSKNLDVMETVTHFAVNVLASDQMDISNNFARTSDDKFVGIDVKIGQCGMPLIAGTVAHLECKKVLSYEGGDHIIFIGEVECFDTCPKAPLLYTNGQYTLAARHPQAKIAKPLEAKEQILPSSDDFIIPLLLRSYWEISDPFYKELEDAGIPITHARILVHLTLEESMTVSELVSAIRLDFSAVSMAVTLLYNNGQLEKSENNRFSISDKGRAHLTEVHERSQRFEKEFFTGYSDEDIEKLKSMLRALIYRRQV